MYSNGQVRTDRLDEAVWREVKRLLHDLARIATEYEGRLDEARRRGSDGTDLAAAEAQAVKLRRSMGRLTDSYDESLVERAKFELRIAGFRQRIRGWEAQIKAMRDEAALQSTLLLVIGRLEDFAKRVHDRMSEVDWHIQRELIRTLVKRVEINVVFRVDGTFPTPDPANPGQNKLLARLWEGWSPNFWTVPAQLAKMASGIAPALNSAIKGYVNHRYLSAPAPTQVSNYVRSCLVLWAARRLPSSVPN